MDFSPADLFRSTKTGSRSSLDRVNKQLSASRGTFRQKVHIGVLLATVALVAYGAIIIWSASQFKADASFSRHLLGIGIGGSFDKCAALAKKALLRPLDEPNADPYYAALEKELLDAINATGFGPQGFGGATTCLGVAIEQKPTHVACLPVAVNISCHVTRRASRTL